MGRLSAYCLPLPCRSSHNRLRPHRERCHPGKKITQAEADALFDTDITKFAATVAPTFAGVQLNGDQFDALVSLSYNIGSLTVKAPTLVRKVKADPNDPTIRAEFMKHVNARVNGVLKPLPGLMKRRAGEADHYFGKI